MLVSPTLFRLAHPFAHFAKGWGVARSATVLLGAALTLCAHAQDPGCALSGIRHSAQLAYPMIGMIARVSGDISLRAHISPDGAVTSVDVISGPEMLKEAAKNYVASWQANDSAIGQVCAVVISFKREGAADCDFHPSAVTMTDLQHFIVTTNPIQTCDPSETITRFRHHFLFFQWYSYSKPQ